MAGNIQWFRWHHGSVTDPKFQLVSRKSGASLSEVIAIWAFVLESASASDERGNFGDIDHEAIDCMLGLDDGMTQKVIEQMAARGIVSGSEVSNWDKRQPKKEDETANDRKRRQREREHELQLAASVTEESQTVTPCHAESQTVTPCHAREEKRREEKKEEEAPRKRSASPERPSDVGEQVWSDWLALRKAKRAPVTETVLASAISEAEKAKLSLDAFLKVWCARGSQGLEAAWLKPDERGSSRALHGSPKYGTPEYFDFHRAQSWWADAGFETVEEACVKGCNHKTYREFRNGSREVAA